MLAPVRTIMDLRYDELIEFFMRSGETEERAIEIASEEMARRESQAKHNQKIKKIHFWSEVPWFLIILKLFWYGSVLYCAFKGIINVFEAFVYIYVLELTDYAKDIKREITSSKYEITQTKREIEYLRQDEAYYDKQLRERLMRIEEKLYGKTGENK